MADTLQAYQLPNSHLPGSTLLSKYIFREPSVKAAILASLFDSEPPSDYYCGDTCLLNGSRCDALYLSRTSMPIMVQAQKKVTKSWLRSILVQCCQVIDDDNNRPTLVIFSVEPLPSDINAMCRVSSLTPYVYDLGMPLFAQKIKLFCPRLINRYLRATASHSPALPPIVILSSFFSSQHPSVHTSANFSKHPFHEELYRHAVQFCHRLAIDLEPIQPHIPSTTTSSAVSDSYQRQSTTSNLPSTSRALPQRRSFRQDSLIITRPHKRRHQSSRSDSTSCRSSHLPPPPPPVISPSPLTPSPTGAINSSSPLENHEEEDQLQDNDDNNKAHAPITDMRQHDRDVIIDYCQEQIDLGKDWQTIYEEGYGKYFIYKNMGSLRRAMIRDVRLKTPEITRVDQQDMDQVIGFCKQLLDEGVSWDSIFYKGNGKCFAYQNPYVLKRVYNKHLNEYEAKHQ